MLSLRVTQCSRWIASTSSGPASRLHTSAVVQVSSYRKRKSRITENANIEKRAELQRLAELNRPHVILGHKSGDDAKWKNCDLAKVLLTEEQILAAPMLPVTTDHASEVSLPEYTNYGVGAQEKSVLFETLPALTTEATHLKITHNQTVTSESLQRVEEYAQFIEKHKATMLARVIDLRNANARGIAYENRRRVIAEFSESAQPNDTGRPEVQAALLTMKIRNLWDHLSKYKKDTSNRRSLRMLVHQRAKILKYLKQVDRDRYDAVLERLGLEPGAVEGELVV